MSSQEISSLKKINLCDLVCPHLLIAVIRTIEELQSGQVIEIRATDLNAPSSIASWSRQSRNPLIDMYEENGCFVFLIQRGNQDSKSVNQQHQDDPARKEGF
ncbi:MAG: sulfurtransferase TusA family protein [Candidatus Promineifilaceae bacterium]|nr:sulfurtransferase TusA family protein [Candidatus Promineifilaceae bacterium]